jgi:hypothetical protein
MTGPRDWDKEMAEIDKLMAADRTPAAPVPAAQAPATPVRRDAAPTAPAPSAAPRPASAAAPSVTRRRDAIAVWLLALLGVLGAVALWYWPYNTACGVWLYGYLIGVAAVAGCGLITMRSAWAHRQGFAHTVGFLTFLAGLAFATVEVLPRIGYAAETRTWTCPS